MGKIVTTSCLIAKFIKSFLCVLWNKLKSKKTSFAVQFFLTGSFFFVELIIGYKSNSMALLADSFHMFSDLLSLVIGLVSLTLSEKNSRNNKLTYGYSRVEFIGAFCNCVFLLVLCLSILVQAILRILSKESIQDPELVLFVGILGLVINIIGVAIFAKDSYSFTCCNRICQNKEKSTSEFEAPLIYGCANCNELKSEHKRNEEQLIAKLKLNSTHHGHHSGGHMNIQGVLFHMIGDSLGSVIVIVSTTVFLYNKEKPEVHYIDPVMSILLALIISYSSISLLIKSARMLRFDISGYYDKDLIVKKLRTFFDCIKDVHSFHIWYKNGETSIASIHLGMSSLLHYKTHIDDIVKFFHFENLHNITIQPEFPLDDDIYLEELIQCNIKPMNLQTHDELTRKFEISRKKFICFPKAN